MRRQGNILKSTDWFTVSLYLVLVIMGWFNIYSASYNPDRASMFDLSQEYGKQFVWIVTACVLAFIVMLLEGDFIRKISPLAYGITIILLVLVLLVGKEVNGAKAWFGVGDFGIQPSEFTKIGISMLLAWYLSQSNTQIEKFKTKAVSVGIIALPAGLIMLQPDTGTVLVFAAYILVLYREGLSGNVLLLGVLAMVLSVTSLLLRTTTVELPFTDEEVEGHQVLMGIIATIAALGMWFISRAFASRERRKYSLLLGATAVGSLLFIATLDRIFEDVLEPHQKIRINILLGLEEDPLGAGYNVKQSQTAIGSGGITGKGYLDGTLTKFKYVPMQSTDFIFCTIGEEWGFVGSAVLVGLFLTLMLRLIVIAERQRSHYTRIYGYAVACIFFLHVLINIGMAIGLAPVIGIPLPFFSYGGSSLWGFTILLFILLKLDTERLVILR